MIQVSGGLNGYEFKTFEKTPQVGWKTRIAQSEPWVKVLVSVLTVAIPALALVPAFVSIGSKAEPNPTQTVDNRYATTPVTVGPGAHIHIGEPGLSMDDLSELKASNERVVRANAELSRALAAKNGIPVQPLMAVLRRFGELDVRQEDVARLLSEKADEYLALREQLQSLALPEVESIRRKALQHLDDGDFDDARLLLQRAREPYRTQREKNARAEAALLADEAKIDGLELRYQAAAEKYEECAAIMHFDPDGKASYLEQQADRLFDQGNELGDNSALERALAVHEELLRMYSPHEQEQRAWTQNRLGKALTTLGAREHGTKRLQEGVEAFEQALRVRTRTHDPHQWAATQNNLGNALAAIGRRTNGTAELQGAVKAYNEALQEWTRADAPLEWATVRANLASTLVLLDEREGGVERFQEAVKLYNEALQERTRERVPLQWAATQNNLGAALEALGEREGGTGHLEKAVAAYEKALLELTRERVPLQWAETQKNLGAALEALGEREGGTERLEKAVAAYEKALLELTRDRAPLQWAAIQNRCGDVLDLLGEREQDGARLQAAVEAYEKALLELTRDRAPLEWARTQIGLGNALRRLGLLESGTERLQRAAAAYRNGVAIIQRSQSETWATEAQNLIGQIEVLIAQRQAAGP